MSGAVVCVVAALLAFAGAVFYFWAGRLLKAGKPLPSPIRHRMRRLARRWFRPLRSGPLPPPEPGSRVLGAA